MYELNCIRNLVVDYNHKNEKQSGLEAVSLYWN